MSKTHYIGPLVPESRYQRRNVLQESVMNAEVNERVLRKFFSDHNPTLSQIPPLLVTSTVQAATNNCTSKLVSRNRSKVQNLIENHLEKRKEKREYFHRNCIPVERGETRRVMVNKVSRDKPCENIVDEEPNEVTVSCVSNSPKSEGVIVAPNLEPEAPIETVNPVIPHDIRELEKLIEETHELLKAEGVVDMKTIFPNKPLASDREILEELEKDLERIVFGQKNEYGAIPDSSLEQLENEINELIKD